MPSISQECFISYFGLILTTFWPSKISIQHFTTDFALFYFFFFSCFSMDKIKASQLGNWHLLFPTHPPLVFIHFLRLAFFSISLTTHSCFFQLVRSLIDLVSALATYGGLLYFGKSAFLSFMSCLLTTQFSYEGCTIYVHYYSSLFNGRIHTNIHLFIHVI